MKKYIKPELFYERFELNQHIADCDWEMKTNLDTNICMAYGEKGTIYENYSLFVTTIDCMYTTDNKAWQDYCYQDGADGMKVFAS